MHVVFRVQGISDCPLECRQNGMDGRGEQLQVKAPSSKRLYNWNTTHFYPDIHKLDDDELSVSRQRRHSEPHYFQHLTDNVSDDRRVSGSSSSLASFSEVNDRQDANMPVSQLTVQLSVPRSAGGPIAKVDVDLDSGSESEDDVPKTWHRSPLHVRRGRRPDASGRSGKKIDSSTSVAVVGKLWKQAADRPSIRLKEQAEKRRRFLQQRCQVYGWDLTADEHSVADGHTEEKQQYATSQSQDDVRYIDDSPESSLVNQCNIECSSADAIRDYVCQCEATETPHASMKDSNLCTEQSGRLVHVGTVAISSPKISSVNTALKESSSFENIYDTVSLEPDKSSDDAEVVQLYEPRQARVNAVYCHTKPSSSNKLQNADLQPSVRPGNYKQNGRYKNLSDIINIANTSVSATAGSFSTARPLSAPTKSAQKPNLDAKSIVEEEKLKFVEYRIEYRRQHSSGNESGSGRSDGEKDIRRKSEPTNKPHKAIPPDDYEYILRKIHYNRPQNKTGQKQADSKPYSANQGSELHIEVKKPQTATRRITIDVEKPAVPHRVESLQHSGSRRQLPSKPDVIPSPNYPSSPGVIGGGFGDGADTGKDLNTCPDRPSRTVLRIDHPPASTVQSALPTPSENPAFQWDSRTTNLHGVHCSSNEPIEAGSQKTEPDRKPPKPPREEELPRSRSPDFWHYNTTYEPSSPSLQPELSKSMLSKDQMTHVCKTEVGDSAKFCDRDLVHSLVRGLDENSELAPEAAAVFHEQYRWSIHEPCRSVKPDQLKHSQLSQLPCSQVFASSVCVPSKAVKLIGQSNEPSSQDNTKVSSGKETVFSVTGYHKPQQQKTFSDDVQSQNIRLKEGRVPVSSDVHASYSSDTSVEPEPLYWYSEADKRKPIVNSPEMETALNRDCQQRYFYCSGRQIPHGQNVGCESSKSGRQCIDVDTGVAGWKRHLCHRDNYPTRDVRKDVRPVKQRSQERLVQQMLVGSQEVTGHLQSNSRHSANSFPASAPRIIHVHTLSDNIHTGKLSTRQPATEVGKHKDLQSTKTSAHVPSRASADYEKRILQGQESYRSQIMAQIEPSSVALGCSIPDKSMNAKNCKNVASASDAGAVSVGISSDGIIHEAQNKKFGNACLANQEKREIHEDEDFYPMNVAEIKAKLFGPNDNGTRRPFQQQNDAVKGSQTCGEQRKRSCASVDLSDVEKLVERLDKGDTPLEDRSQWCSTSPTVTGAHCSPTDDPTVKRLSITNIKMLEGSRGKQSPSLEYAKEWLANGRRASASVNSDKSSEQMSYVAEGNTTKSTVQSVPDVGTFVSHRSMKSLPCRESDDACRPVVVSSVKDSSITSVSKSSTGMLTSTSTDGSVAFRSRPFGHQPLSITDSFSNSFARRSLPALTEKDAERWRNMVSRVQENESQKEAESGSVEQWCQPRSNPQIGFGSTVNTQTSVGVLTCSSMDAERKSAARPLLHSLPDIMMPVPADAASLKPKRQQTPRDVKYRDESRIKGIRTLHTKADSGYLDGESDSHGSSGTDVSKRLPSESNESDELELQRYTCDEDDDVKLSGGSSSVTNTDPCFTSTDKTNAPEGSASDYKVITGSPESRARNLQKLRENWFSKNMQQSHSSSASHRSQSFSTPNLDTPKADSSSSEFGRSVPLSHGVPKEKPVKPLYVSPLVQTSGCGIYRAPSYVVSRGADPCSVNTVDSAQLSGPSKVSSFKTTLPSQVLGQNTGGGGRSTVTSQASKVTHIPVRMAGFHAGHSSAHSSAFSPYVEHKDLQISRKRIGDANVTEVQKQLIQVEPEQFRASRLLERTRDQPSLKTYQTESEQFRHQRQELKEPNVKITRQVTDSKTERTYRTESHPWPKAAPVMARNQMDRYETSDGEMTDATDITLDVMVGANQSLTPTADFSDVEFLSSANLPKQYDASFVKGDAAPCVSHPFEKNLTADGSRDAAVAAAKADMQLHKKNKIHVKTDEGEPPAERRRSIKELVDSFEGLTSPFMRARPRSMEIHIDSLEEESHGDDATGRKRNKITLRTSSSFKEPTRLDRMNRHQSAMNQ